MKTTEECIKYLSTHAWLKKSFVKLKQADIVAMANFLDLKIDSKELAVKELNKFLLSNSQSKNKLIIDELLCCAINFRFN